MQTTFHTLDFKWKSLNSQVLPVCVLPDDRSYTFHNDNYILLLKLGMRANQFHVQTTHAEPVRKILFTYCMRNILIIHRFKVRGDA